MDDENESLKELLERSGSNLAGLHRVSVFFFQGCSNGSGQPRGSGRVGSGEGDPTRSVRV